MLSPSVRLRFDRAPVVERPVREDPVIELMDCLTNRRNGRKHGRQALMMPMQTSAVPQISALTRLPLWPKESADGLIAQLVEVTVKLTCNIFLVDVDQIRESDEVSDADAAIGS